MGNGCMSPIVIDHNAGLHNAKKLNELVMAFMLLITIYKMLYTFVAPNILCENF